MIDRAKVCQLLTFTESSEGTEAENIESVTLSAPLLLSICEGIRMLTLLDDWIVWIDYHESSMDFYYQIRKELPEAKAKLWTKAQRIDVTLKLMDYLKFSNLSRRESLSPPDTERFIDQLVDEFLASRRGEGKSIAVDGLEAFSGLYDMKAGSEHNLDLETYVKLDKLEDLTDYTTTNVIYDDERFGFSRFLKESFDRRGGLSGFCKRVGIDKESYLINFSMNINRVGYRPSNLPFLINWVLRHGGTGGTGSQILTRLLLEDHFPLDKVLLCIAPYEKLCKEAVGVVGRKAIWCAIPKQLAAAATSLSEGSSKRDKAKNIRKAMADHEIWIADIVELLTDYTINLPTCLAKLSVSYLE